MYMWSWYIDPVYFLILIITLVISIAAQAYLKSTYGKWSRTKNSSGLNGIQVGQVIIQQTHLGIVSTQAPTPVETPELRKLAQLRDQGLVTEAEYNAKETQIQGEQRDVVVSKINECKYCVAHHAPRLAALRGQTGAPGMKGGPGDD